ncbi:ribonuclease H-like domain-containing protein [Amylostereum chailletii]|nr:ribonuclease H-like domain-containing protein [Amylostereum chailletii]
MPYYTYKEYAPRPTVVYIRTEEEADDAIENLSGPIGFDLEWKVAFLNGGSVREGPAALVQVCDTSMILLIQVTSMKTAQQVLIESPTIPKMGVNIRNDGMKLYRDYSILASNLIELGALACQADARFETAFGRPIVSLAKVVAFYLRRTLDKGPVRTSNWEAELSREQMSYAANDAHCGLMVYRKIMLIALATKRPLSPAGYTSDLAKELEAPQPRLVTGSSDNPTLVEPSESKSSTSPTRRKTAAASKTANKAASSRVRPQHLRAFSLWKDGHGLLDICIRMRNKENPLKEATVITYIVNALDADPSLAFSFTKLKAFVQMESGSWVRHRECIMKMVEEGRGGD